MHVRHYDTAGHPVIIALEPDPFFDLTEEYEDWLAEHPHLPPMSADELCMELSCDPKAMRPVTLQAEIDWLHDFIRRWEAAENDQS